MKRYLIFLLNVSAFKKYIYNKIVNILKKFIKLNIFVNIFNLSVNQIN